MYLRLLILQLSFFLRRAGAFAPLHSPEVYSLLPFRLLFLLPILAQYYAFVTQRGVWSPRGHSVLVPYGRLFTISHLRGYIARYICEENTLTRLYI